MKIKDKKWLGIGLIAILLIGGFVAVADTPMFQASVLGNTNQQAGGAGSPAGTTEMNTHRTLNVLDNGNGCDDSDFDTCYRNTDEYKKAYADAIIQANDIDVVDERNGVNYVEEGEEVEYACGEEGGFQGNDGVYHDTYLYYGDDFDMSWNGVKPVPNVGNYDELDNEGSFEIDWSEPRELEIVCVGYQETWDGQWTYVWTGIDWYDEYAVSPDSDGDGVPDFNDECPNQAGTEETAGCPDSDGDGVRDSQDEFPLDPECQKDSDGDGVCDSKDAFPNDPSKQYDQDGDGVADSVDECPRNAGDPQFNGCPDSDGDGVPDNQDSCPNEGDQGFGLKENGCPVADTDGDGVGDDVDQCPGTASEASVDSEGCALDDDNDGVPNYQDECPGTGNPELGVNDQGCAIQDADQDGVTDSVDQCPQTYGSKTTGCPTFLDQVINTLGLRGLFG